MSWQTLNEVLIMAAVDPDFCQALLKNPVATIEAHHWKLTAKERQILASLKARDLAEFSQLLLAHLPQDPPDLA